MPKHTIAYLDCSMGLSEEMLLAALCDCGFDLDILKRTLAPSSLHSYTFHQHRIQADSQMGISGTRITLVIDGKENIDSQGTLVRVGQTTRLPYADRTDVEAIIQSMHMNMDARKQISVLVQRLMATQATVAGIDEASIRWSEQELTRVLIILSGVVLACTELGITRFLASALPLPGEVAADAQNDFASSALTMELLRQTGAPWRARSVKGALVTPLAATILAELASFELPDMIFRHIGYGFAPFEQAYAQRCLRLCIGEVQEITATGDMDVDRVMVIESNIDNMTGELLGALLERLLALGALDVNYTAIYMKKDRPATMITVICKEGDEHRFAYILLRETTTLGVRIQPMQRLKAQREQLQIETQLGPMLVKVKRLGASFVSASPEYEECQRVAKTHNIPLIDVYEVARKAISKAIEQGVLEGTLERKA